MRVLVGVKRVVDYAVKVRIQPDKAGTAVLQAICVGRVPNKRLALALLKLPVVPLLRAHVIFEVAVKALPTGLSWWRQ